MDLKTLIETINLEDYGIVDWGVVSTTLPQSYEKFQSWVDKGNAAPLKYLEDHRKELRKNLKNVYSSYKSCIVFLFSYSRQRKGIQEFYNSQNSNQLRMGSYTLSFEGKDYHFKLLESLKQISEILNKKLNNFECSYSLDIQPVLERDFAYQAGLGWFGKNSMLINRKYGSFTMIGSILTNQSIKNENVLEIDHCGSCNACVESCPTNAIDPINRTIIAKDCISTYTIELFKDADPPSGIENGNNEIFGCDICQDVCPWNVKYDSKITSIPLEKSKIKEFFLERSIDEIKYDLNKMSNKEYKRVFKETVLERTGRLGMLKNLKRF